MNGSLRSHPVPLYLYDSVMTINLLWVLELPDIISAHLELLDVVSSAHGAILRRMLLVVMVNFWVVAVP